MARIAARFWMRLHTVALAACGLAGAQTADSTVLLRLQLPSAITATAVDTSGNIFLAGSIFSNSLPVSPGAFQRTYSPGTCAFGPCADGFVAKMGADGRLLFATYLGGSGSDQIFTITLDPAGNPIVAGRTDSTDFPVTLGAVHPRTGAAFVSRLSADGSSLLASTYLGGVTPYAATTDADGSVYLAGATGMAALGVEGPPITPGAYQRERRGPSDAFVLKLNRGLSAMSYATLLGGGGSEWVNAITVDAAGNAYVTGATDSTRLLAGDTGMFPVVDGSYRSEGGSTAVFVAKLNSTGSALTYSAVFGGSDSSAGLGLAVDNAGTAYVAGVGLRNYPFSLQGTGEGFAAAVAPDGTRLLYTAQIAGGRFEVRDFLYSVTIGPSNTLLVRGALNGPIQTTPDSLDPCRRSGDFVLALDRTTGSVRYATVLARALASDSAGNVWMVKSETSTIQRVRLLAPLEPQVTCVANAADYQDTAVAPGEIISLFGSSLGPEPAEMFTLDSSGRVPARLGGVEVLFDGVPAPLLYVSRTQINAVVPFAVSGRQVTSIRVVRSGRELPEVSRTFALSSPAIFGALNPDGSVISTANPAKAGSTISVYLTGAGLMEPPPADGSLGTGQTRVAAPVHAFLFTPRMPGPLDTAAAEIVYAGDAPALVQGLVQINVTLPDRSFPSGILRLLIGDTSTSIAMPVR